MFGKQILLAETLDKAGTTKVPCGVYFQKRKTKMPSMNEATHDLYPKVTEGSLHFEINRLHSVSPENVFAGDSNQFNGCPTLMGRSWAGQQSCLIEIWRWED